MAELVLDHVDKIFAHGVAAVRDLCLQVKEGEGRFAQVQVNDTLTMDFDQLRPVVESIHYAFHVSDVEFDDIYGRVKAAGIAYGSGPFSRADMQINHRRGGRGFYFEDPNGHVLEVLTA